MPKMISVAAGDNYTLEIELDHHHKIIYDMKPRLKAVRFCSLCDLERFKSLRIEGGKTIVWDSLCQISIDEIICSIER